MYTNNLKTLREKHNFTQKKVADDLKYSYSTYNDWEQNETTIPIQKADKFALYYKVSLSVILGINNNIYPQENLKPLNYEKLLSNLTKLKNENHDTYEKIGNSLHYKRQNIHRYFTGQRIIPTHVLIELSKYYKKDIDELCGKK